jgi:Aldo/keto reductase family
VKDDERKSCWELRFIFPRRTGPTSAGFSALNIRRSCEHSLRGLKTDYIDIYQFHHIDRNTPWEEIWQATEQLVQEGKGRIVKDGVKQALRDRQLALAELVHAVQHYRKVAESKPLTLQGSEYPQAVQTLNKAIDRVEGLLIANLSLGRTPLR